LVVAKKGRRGTQKSVIIAFAILLALLLSSSLVFHPDSANAQETQTPTVTSIVINEVMADNEAAVEGPYGTYPDWVELYNPSNETLDVGGMYLCDRLSNPTWQFSAGTVIEPHGFLLVWADGDSSLGSMHTDFRINANGETIALFADDGVTLVDSVQLEKQLEDVSFGRSPDGGSSWKYMTKPTPGSANFDNSRQNVSENWLVWLAISLSLAACAVYVLRDRLRLGRKR
jgi:hypothetical protein